MKSTRRLVIIILMGLVAHRLPAAAPEVSRDGVFKRLVTVLDELTEQMSKNASDLPALHRGLDFRMLQERVRQSLVNAKFLAEARINYSTLFLRTTDYDREAFDSYAQTLKRGAFVNLLVYNHVNDAHADLGLKATLVQKSGKSVVGTTVNTLDQQGKAVNDCDVFFAPFLKDDPLHREKFDKRSTPTTDLIPAGRWFIWSEKQGKIGAKTTYSCGNDGRDVREIDIPGPD
jgi:hypothetical protein